MALPVILGAVGATLYAMLPESIGKIAKEEFEHIAESALKASGITDALMGAALESMGIDSIENVKSEAGITRIVNNMMQQAGLELEFSNVFDRSQVKSEIKRFGLQRLASAIGADASTENGITDAVRQRLMELARQAAAGEGEFADSVPLDPELAAAMQEALAEMRARLERQQAKAAARTPEQESNRLRQAKFRATHRKVWVSDE
jgi:hypothetical protein